MKPQKQEPQMDLDMDQLSNLVTTRPTHMGWQSSIERYPSTMFGFIDNPYPEFRNGSFWTSVINGSKSGVRFWVEVGTELDPLQLILLHLKTEPHRTHGFLAVFIVLQTEYIGSN